MNSDSRPNDVPALIADVGRSREKVLEMVRDLTDHEGRWKPSPEEWSAAEIVEHLFLAEMAGIEKIWHAAAFSDRRSVSSQNEGQSIEEIVARTWKTREKAPPVATPRGEGPLSFWVASLESCQATLDSLGVRLAGLDLELIVFPHFLSGPLDARQRLEFLRFHLERHRDQLSRLAALR